MLNQNFIISDKRSDRIKRHMVFWFIMAFYFALLQAANPLLKPSSSYFNNIPFTLTRSFLMLVPQAFAAYCSSIVHQQETIAAIHSMSYSDLDRKCCY